MQCVQQAPESNSVQVIQVEAQGKKTHLIEKRKVKFVSYNPVTIILTDKQIYNPGQTGIFALHLFAVFASCFYADLNMFYVFLNFTVQFRIFTVDQNLKPVDETVGCNLIFAIKI